MAGRWFGVRGRRFVRPALTLIRKGGAVRALAELDDKPWAAQDGEVWRAAFSLQEGLNGAREIELTVAPDIVLELRPKGKRLAKPGDTLQAGTTARAPRFKGEAVAVAEPATELGSEPAAAAPSEPTPTQRRRPVAGDELERLGARLASANDALQQERERRATLATALEEERTVNRQLRTELGQARSELEVAAAAQAEAAAVEAELDATRRELRETQRRHEQATQQLTRQHDEASQELSRRHEQATQGLTRQHDEVAQAHAALRQELAQTAAALQSAREALAAERAETGRLRNRLGQAREIAQGSSPSPSGPEPRGSRRAVRARPSPPREPDPARTQQFDVLGLGEELGTAQSPAPRPASRPAGGPHIPDSSGWPPPPTADRLRPVNPSLRHRTWWLGRLLALVVLLGVLVAVWIVLHSTVLH